MWGVIKIFFVLLPVSVPLVHHMKPAFVQERADFRMPYDLSSYDDLLNLPGSLSEISGLSYDPDRRMLLAVNDEQGIIFFIDPGNGEVTETVKFESSGDYEGIAWVDKKVYIAKSNGNIYVYDLVDNSAGERIKTDLKSGNDVEGLAYLREKNGLAIACKGRAQIDKDDRTKGVKAIYFLDLEQSKMEKEPIIWVEDNLLASCMQEQEIYLNASRKGQGKLIRRVRDFSPSGIAQHPFTSDLYVLSSVGKILVVLSANGDLLSVFPLDDRFHRQPEAICFDLEGNLYIGNEGKGLVAKIYKYQPVEQ